VNNVTWFEAIEYCNALSAADPGGLDAAYSIAGTPPNAVVTWNRDADGWRLPTEAEWEWLCRAGTTTAFHNGDITVIVGPDPVLNVSGWYISNSGNAPQVAGRKLANAWGLHDVHGNVAEWCWDLYGGYPDAVSLDPEGPAQGLSRVIRGGSWFHGAEDCRAGNREAHVPDSRSNYVGLRVVRTLLD
jgi:formylglycine-generating enzyme required for sulfatase activity